MMFRPWTPVMEAKKDEQPAKDDYEDLTEPTDYTNEDPDTDAPDDTAEPTDGDPPADDAESDEPTDYTTETEEDPPADADGETPTEDTPESAPDDTTDTESDDNGDVTENQNNKVLIGDFVELYHRCRSLLQKIDGIEKNNLVVNQIVIKVSSNLQIIESSLFEYVRTEANKRTYTQNLVRYNLYIEGLRINVEMLEKISVFSENKQNK